MSEKSIKEKFIDVVVYKIAAPLIRGLQYLSNPAWYEATAHGAIIRNNPDATNPAERVIVIPLEEVFRGQSRVAPPANAIDMVKTGPNTYEPKP